MHKTPDPPATPYVTIGLNAAIVTVTGDQPQILTVPQKESRADTLPFGPFDPLAHRTLEIGLRNWVQEQTQLELGYVEQLYTFGDRGRHAALESPAKAQIVSVGYFALTRSHNAALSGAKWTPWYRYFPWEDWRGGRPHMIDGVIIPLLADWARTPPERAEEWVRGQREDRVRLCFGGEGLAWDDEKTLERYELLYEAGLVAEAARDERPGAQADCAGARLGRPMQFDHRRILATAMGRARAKLKYRPVIFEVMPPAFTLGELQRTTEALLGFHLHKQNFRRLVDKGGLVEPTGQISTLTGGRPAEQYRFRREVLNERPAPGLRLAPSRSGAQH